MNGDTHDTTHPAVILAVTRASEHYALADGATDDAERKAHRRTASALDKAAMQMIEGNFPRPVSGNIWLCNSRTVSGTVYQIDLGTQQCRCKNGYGCWHLAAVNICAEVAEAKARATAQ